MMLFDIIRDWFVQYIFGGLTSSGVTFSPFIGSVMYSDATADTIGTTGLFVNIGFNLPNDGDGTFYNIAMSFGDWLSTTSTIIVLVLMCVFLFICVRYLFKVGAGLFSNLRG